MLVYEKETREQMYHTKLAASVAVSAQAFGAFSVKVWHLICLGHTRQWPRSGDIHLDHSLVYSREQSSSPKVARYRLGHTWQPYLLLLVSLSTSHMGQFELGLVLVLFS